MKKDKHEGGYLFPPDWNKKLRKLVDKQIKRDYKIMSDKEASIKGMAKETNGVWLV